MSITGVVIVYINKLKNDSVRGFRKLLSPTIQQDIFI